MNKKILTILVLVGVSYLYMGRAFAGACLVTTEKADYSETMSLPYLIEKTTYNRSGGGCWITDSYADKATADQYIAFQTAETEPSNASDEVHTIVLKAMSSESTTRGQEATLYFKPLDTMIVGNPSEAAINGENEATYDVDNSGYILENGEIKDYGFVVIDGRTNFAKKSEGDEWTDNLPIKCVEGASDVFLRNLIIITNGYSKTNLLDDSSSITSCFKDGGNLHVCNGTYKENSDPNTDSDWCDSDGFTILPPDGFHPFDCDDEDKITWYADTDADGFGDPNNSKRLCPIFTPSGYTKDDDTDCDDTNAAINPDAQEICDGADNDCDALIDDADDSVTGQGTYYTDADADTFGDAAAPVTACSQPAGTVTDSTDCNDVKVTVYPGAVEICDDSGDNDCDLLVDCDDDACATATECSPTGTTETLCDDAVDNDLDGALDCADVDCVADPACVSTTETLCDDSLDNDSDGSVDCFDIDCTADPACVGVPGLEVCDDAFDNDSDTFVDCDDSDCDTHTICNGVGPEEICDDQVDNDEDSATDCSDDDCLDDVVCSGSSAEVCTDGIDNDVDTFIDCDDTDCVEDAVCAGQLGAEVCNDSFDNDTDGALDCADDDCLTSQFCISDQVETECDNDLDDDNDGSSDCDDGDCIFDAACANPNETPESDCTNGDDDDGDGFDDCDDEDCEGAILSGELVCTSLDVGSVPDSGSMEGGAGGCGCNLTAESGAPSLTTLFLVLGSILLIVVVRRGRFQTDPKM